MFKFCCWLLSLDSLEQFLRINVTVTSDLIVCVLVYVFMMALVHFWDLIQCSVDKSELWISYGLVRISNQLFPGHKIGKKHYHIQVLTACIGKIQKGFHKCSQETVQQLQPKKGLLLLDPFKRNSHTVHCVVSCCRTHHSNILSAPSHKFKGPSWFLIILIGSYCCLSAFLYLFKMFVIFVFSWLLLNLSNCLY